MTTVPVATYTVPARYSLASKDTMVSRELLYEFKMIYKEEFNIAITDEEATEMSTELVNLMKVLLKPDPIPELENSNNQIERGEPNETGRILSK